LVFEADVIVKSVLVEELTAFRLLDATEVWNSPLANRSVLPIRRRCLRSQALSLPEPLSPREDWATRGID
jgi:hypothetical protein